ncbi:hypothetical protein BWI93_20860 [Siphonobacter sp. BAB-5385]|uniref:DUF190 domain-containing protein n=1 Tax=unclassified Siphonobacter TaxID=2635712 RepID=UPI000B9EDF32|nr:MULTISPECIES: DUF190 domain-containing protein [unclassified Siphonobacter]OZI06270.1 hypothetical protein BWI93_20860 [Siphonobacter sp. BAB-5385]PMD93125.1 hypothetical protein BWI97_18915 [Siphonobacter sp. BAB-5405]
MLLQAQIILNKDEMDDQGHPLYLTILQWMVQQHLPSARVLEGISGIGQQRIIHPGALFSFDEPPILILFEAEAERVRHALREIRQFSPTALMLAYEVELF